MRAIYFLFLSLLYLSSAAQNLVPNPSFEDTVSCPTNGSQLNKALYWINPTQGSPDYFNACSTGNFNIVHIPDNGFGFQYAKTGNAYAGFYTGGPSFPVPNGREYVQTTLTSTLVAGKQYYVSFYVNHCNYSKYSTSKIGAYFSVIAPTRNDMLYINVIPQVQNSLGVISDTLNWILISGAFTAQGGEQYLTIGNFFDDANTDTVATRPGGFSAHYYYIDDISVIDSTLGINYLSKTDEIKLYPNPTDGNVYISGFAVSDKVTAVEVLDITGKLVSKQSPSVLNGVIELNLNVNNGVYFIKILNEGKQNKIEKVIISK